jgi:hypothetical protein
LLRRHETYPNTINPSRDNMSVDEPDNPSVITSYYPREVRRASAREVAAGSQRERAEIQQQQNLIKAQTRDLKMVAEDVDVRLSLRIFFIEVSISIAIGVLLNEGGAETSVIAGCLYSGLSLARVWGSILDGIRFLRLEDNRLDVFGSAESRRWTL